MFLREDVQKAEKDCPTDSTPAPFVLCGVAMSIKKTADDLESIACFPSASGFLIYGRISVI